MFELATFEVVFVFYWSNLPCYITPDEFLPECMRRWVGTQICSPCGLSGWAPDFSLNTAKTSKHNTALQTDRMSLRLKMTVKSTGF